MAATSITQAQVALLARESRFTALTEHDAALVASIVEKRLLLALCMTEPPLETSEDFDLWLQLLAAAIVAFDDVAQSDGVQSESMRNYSYTLRDSAGTWAELSISCADLIAHFSLCESGVDMQTDATVEQYGPYEPQLDWPVGGIV